MTARLLLEYDGSDFGGWARQPGARTVQETLEDALATVLRREARLSVAGRTDRGVRPRALRVAADNHAGSLRLRLRAGLGIGALALAPPGPRDERRDIRTLSPESAGRGHRPLDCRSLLRR